MADEIFDGGLLEELLNDAVEASEQFSSRSQFGRLTYGQTTYWRLTSPREELTKEQYQKARQNRERSLSAQIEVNVHVKELNPTLEWDSYTRNISISDWAESDWMKHWQASIVRVFNLEEQLDPDKTKKEQAADLRRLVIKAMGSLAGKYVEIHDVPQEKQNVADKTYRTPELAMVFDSREACVAEYTNRFGRAPGGGAVSTPSETQDAPEGFKSYAEFVGAVKDLQDAGLSNLEISRELEVSVAKVTLVK